jgi:hypothetical protein
MSVEGQNMKTGRQKGGKFEEKGRKRINKLATEGKWKK